MNMSQSDWHLGIANVRFGEVIYQPGGTFGPRIQKNLQLVIIYRGEAEIKIDEATFYLPAQHVSLHRPGHREFFQFAKDQETHHSWCSFDFSQEQMVQKLPFCVPLSRRMEELVKLGLRVPQGASPYDQLLLTRLAECIFLEFLRAAHLQEASAKPLPEALRRAQAYIDHHYADPLRLEDLARAALVTPPHLIRLFRKHLALTPMRYLWQVRMRQGVWLLRNTGFRIADIAYRTGFQTPAHFSRLVKRHYQKSPKEIREHYWSAKEESIPSHDLLG